MESNQILLLYNLALNSLKKEMDAFTNDGKIWETTTGVGNSAGNLCLHLTGNVNHFIGATLGNTGFVRNREAEFNTKGLEKAALLKQIDEAMVMLGNVIPAISQEKLKEEYPFDFAGKENTEYYLLFFIAHFHYHLGQINYLRRILG